MGELRKRLKAIRQGDSGMVPILIGIIILGAYFQYRSSAFLSSGNLTNLFIQSTPFMLLGMAEIWLLLLGDIDLAVGWITAVGAAIAVILVDLQYHWPWFFALPLAILATTAIGAIQGMITIFFKVPSFIVTLAGSLIFEGVAIYLIDANNAGGSIPIHGGILHDIANVNMSPLFTWIFSLAVAGAMAFLVLNKDRNRRASGLDSVPLLETLLKMGALVGAAIVLALIFNANRGSFIVIEGMPYAVPVVAVVLASFSFILTKTKIGRYLYAIGGNVEAARRAGIAVNRYRLLAFAMTGLTAGVAGLVYASTLGGISDGIPGGTLVLYSVAAAVIGGTSLYGGRGKMIDALVGGLVIGVIYNGMALIQLTASVEFIATGFVLLAAIAIDSIARRGASSGTESNSANVERSLYTVLNILLGVGYLSKVPVKKALADAGLATMTSAESLWYVALNVLLGHGYLHKVPVKKALSDSGLATMTSAESTWYTVLWIFLGAGYLAKVPVKKALHETGHGEMTSAEKFWYFILCLLIGAGYFAKIPVKRALNDMTQNSPSVID